MAPAPPSTRLKFKGPLLQKNSTSDALLKRLRTLHLELSSADPDAIDLSSLSSIKDELVKRDILVHKDQGVKAFAACCIADLLKFYAPNAPYDSHQIEDIFNFFLNLLSSALRPTRSLALPPTTTSTAADQEEGSTVQQQQGTRSTAPTVGPTKNEFYRQYFYLVESVATCKSVILCLDAEESRVGQVGADGGAVKRFFEVFLEVARYDLPRTLTDHMVDILATLIDECQALSTEIRDLLLSTFDKRRAGFSENSLDMAVSVCGFEYPMQKLERSFAQYFMEALLQPASSSGKKSSSSAKSKFANGGGGKKKKSAFVGSDDEDDSDLSDDLDESSSADEGPRRTKHSTGGGGSSTKTLERTHELLRSIVQHAPLTLLSTLPVLESELENPSLDSRLSAVLTLGKLWNVRPPLGGEIVSKAKGTWAAWVRRGKDREWKIRKGWVEQMGGLLRASGGGVDVKGIVEPHLRLKITDPDERVREATALIFSKLEFEVARQTLTKETLVVLSDRFSDKKIGVRAAAIHSLAKLYSLASSEIDDSEENALHLFGWIPDRILLAASRSTPAVRDIIERALYDHILPLPPKGDSADLWTDKLLLVLRSLEPSRKKALLALAGFGSQKGSYGAFVRVCEEWNGGTVDEGEEEIRKKKESVFKLLAGQFPDPAKAKNDMDEFADANENRLIKLLKSAMDPQTDLKTLVKINTEFGRRCPPNLFSTMSIILRRGSLPCINTSSLPTLLKRLQGVPPSTSPAGSTQDLSPEVPVVNAENAKLILQTVSKVLPSMWKAHVAELGKLLVGEVEDGQEGDPVEVWLQALAHLERVDESAQIVDKPLLDRVVKYGTEGTARQAKFAARLLAYSRRSESLTKSLAKTLASRLDTANDAQLSAALAGLSELGRSAPDALESQSEKVIGFILREFATQDHRLESLTEKEEEEVLREWTDDDKLTDRAKAKLASLKLCVNRSLSHAQTEDAVQVVTPVLKMLLTILMQKGSFVHESDGCMMHARMRLQASRSLLKLARPTNFADLIKPNFLILAVEVQDPSFFVRQNFIKKLVELLRVHQLHYDFTVMLYLAAHDEDDIKTFVRTQIKQLVDQASRASDGRERQLIVYGFVRLIHLLAHHPDYSKTPEDLLGITKYLDFFLDIVATKDNVSLLYALASKVKTIRDRDEEYDENLYVVGELAMHLIQRRTKTHHWTLDSYPGHIKMPGDLFRPMVDKDEVQKNRIRVYLPEETLKSLRDVKAAAPKKEKEEKAAATKRKRATDEPKKKKPKKKAADSDDEDEASASDLSEPPSEDEEVVEARKPRPKPKARTTKSKAAEASEDEDAEMDMSEEEPPISDILEMEVEEEEAPLEVEGEEVLGRGGRRQATKPPPAKSRKTGKA